MARLRRLPRPPLPRFAVAWFPAFAGLDGVEAFRRRHDPAAGLIPAHVSLVFPFGTALKRIQVETHVRRVVSRWPVIPVSFKAVRSEANEFVFLMASRGAASITGLHDALYTRSLRHHLRPEFPYAPHITIARNADVTRVEAALEEARDIFTRETSDVLREVALLAVAPDGRIERLSTLPLDCA
jgi:2'-5' RNA ligase